MTQRTLYALIALCLLALTGCGLPTATAEPASPQSAAVMLLPTPVLDSETSIEEALVGRRSVRELEDIPLTAAELGQLLWASQGITSQRGLRTAPSAGALYPLEVYVASEAGLYHYDPQGHRLLTISHEDFRLELYQAALRQEPVRDAPAILILAAVYERTEQKYGAERGPRYVHLEAGHAAQNLLLEAVALGLGAVPIGAFQDEQVQHVLGLPSDHEPLYLIPVGRSRGEGQ